MSDPSRPVAPKVFVSHASEDKAPFVIEFARRLRAQGIDAWLDKWEMLPGDSLVDKLFEEGIRNAQAVIVVLSKYSVEKPWVRQELNAAVVKRINGGTKLIPVVIDECEIPAALRSTLYERISDLASYDAQLERIIAAVTGLRDKPPLGPMPAHTQAVAPQISGMARIDSMVLKAIAEEALRSGGDPIEGQALLALETLSSIPSQEVADSLDVLETEGHVKLIRLINAGLPIATITPSGFQRYAKSSIADYESFVSAVAAALANGEASLNTELKDQFDRDQFLVDHALDVLDAQGYIRMTKFIDGTIRVHEVTARLRRALSP